MHIVGVAGTDNRQVEAPHIDGNVVVIGRFPGIAAAIDLDPMVLDARLDYLKSVLYYCRAWPRVGNRGQGLVGGQHMPCVLLDLRGVWSLAVARDLYDRSVVAGLECLPRTLPGYADGLRDQIRRGDWLQLLDGWWNLVRCCNRLRIGYRQGGSPSIGRGCLSERG